VWRTCHRAATQAALESATSKLGDAYNRGVVESRAGNASLWIVLVFPSSLAVHKYLGWDGTIAYMGIVALAVALRARLLRHVSGRALLWLAALMSVGVVAAFLAGYPIANVQTPGAGSDDDDALNLGAAAVLGGHFPYRQTTYLGNVLHHLPGAYILAAPFTALGTSALQNLFWLAAFFATVNRVAGRRAALELLVLVFALDVDVIHQVVTGTGYLANAIFVVLGLWWLVRTAHRDAAAIAWGLTLASRANFLFLLPLAFGYLQHQAGWKPAWRAATLSAATVAALTLPYYLYDPSHFAPLEAADRVLVFNQLAPHLGVALIAAMAALAAALSFRSTDLPALFRNCAVVQAFPVVAGVVLVSLRDRHVDLSYARYGSFFGWFALMALAIAPPLDGVRAQRGLCTSSIFVPAGPSTYAN
jgi:hypothetical protein